nr:GNAT family protein [Deinococcus hopiensis]
MEHDVMLSDGAHTLRPLAEADIPDLIALASRNVHEYIHMGVAPTAEVTYLHPLRAADQMPFVQLLNGELAGCTRYLEIRPVRRSLEIGGTWLAPQFMRTGANRTFKRLLLAHAFEVMGTSRVKFKTDIRNLRSQVAIAALGAVREGVLRKDRYRLDGTARDTVVYSITDDEWPSVKARLPHTSQVER